MANEFVARKGLISLSTSSFYGPVNFSGSSLVGIGTGNVLFTNVSGSVTGSSNFTYSSNILSLTRDNGINSGTLDTILTLQKSSTLQSISLGYYSRSGTANDGVGISFDKATYFNFLYQNTVVGGYGNSGMFSFGDPLHLINGVIGILVHAKGGVQINSNTTGFVTNASYAMVYATNNTGGGGDLVLQPRNNASRYIHLVTGATPTLAMSVTPAQNILIGNTTTDAGYRLDVNGSGSASGSLRVSGSAYFANNVGIGTATPNSPLHVAGNTYVGSALHVESGIYFNEGGGAFSRRTIWLDVGTNNVYFRLPDNKGSFVYQDWDTSSNLFLINGSGSAYIKRSLIINKPTNTGYTFEVNSTGLPSGSLLISGSTTQPAVLGNSLTSVNIVPTMVFTTGSQTQTAFKVMPTFSGSSTFTSSQTNIIADFGATSVGSQLIVTDVTSGSIYMVNDVSGIPIIEANSNWDVLMYDYPYTVFKKTGSVVELGALGQPSSSVLFKSDLVINEGLGFSYRQSQVSASVSGAVTSSLYNLTFTNVSSSVYIQAVVTGYDTGSRDTITGDIKATIRYRAGAATIVGIDQSFLNSDNSVVGFDIVAGGTSGSLVAFGTGSRTYQFGATVTTQII